MAEKEYDFLVTLKSNIALKVNLVSQLMLAIAMLFFIYVGFLYYNVSHEYAYISFGLVAIIFAILIYNILTHHHKYYRYGILLSGVLFIWFFGTSGIFYWLIGILYIIAGLMEKQAKQPQELGFDKEGITTNSIVAKRYAWNELTNVLIKNNLLTIDFKNNKLFQKELQNPVDKETETEFNNFCKDCLSNKTAL